MPGKNSGNDKSRNRNSFRTFKILVVFSLAVIFVLFSKWPYGHSLYDRLTGAYVKPVHTSLSFEQASKIKVMIDAGHGGFDKGATTRYMKETEAEINLIIAKKLKGELENLGFVVEMTRTDDSALADSKDADMKKRQQMIYKSNADVLISIHMNTHQDPSVNGPIVFFMPGSQNGSELAELIQISMNDELAPAAPKNARSSNFLVLRSGNMPAVLIECGFMTNKKEAKKLSSEAYQNRVVQSISWGIMDYFAKRV